MSAVATWPGMLGARQNLSRTNGLWSPAASPRLVTGYPSNGKGPGRSDGRLAGAMDRDEKSGGSKPVIRRENTAARAAASVPSAPPADVDWTVLVERCLRGDGGAWAELVRSHHRRVYGMCYRFTGSAHDAEDLTQEVFLKLYGNLRSFDTTRGSLQVWITTMTRNLLVDNFRRTKNQRATGSLDDGWDQTERLKPIDRLNPRGPSPHQIA